MGGVLSQDLLSMVAFLRIVRVQIPRTVQNLALRGGAIEGRRRYNSTSNSSSLASSGILGQHSPLDRADLRSHQALRSASSQRNQSTAQAVHRCVGSGGGVSISFSPARFFLSGSDTVTAQSCSSNRSAGATHNRVSQTGDPEKFCAPNLERRVFGFLRCNLVSQR